MGVAGRPPHKPGGGSPATPSARGLGNPQIVHDFSRMVKEKTPNLVFLMETKSRRNKMEKIRTKLGFPNMFVVEVWARVGV
jgi:hypothetical protein